MKVNIFKRLVVWVVIAIFLWSNLVWAGGVEYFKLSAPPQAVSLVNVAGLFARGQKTVEILEESGVRTKEDFYRILSKGRIEELDEVPCLVFSAKDDPHKLAYYVFNPGGALFLPHNNTSRGK